MPIDIEALLSPISPADPCGSDLRDHPIYVQIREVRRQEDDLNQGVWKRELKAADYPQALKLCKEALTKIGKDLQVTAWMTEALVRLDGFAGLQQGLALIHRLLDTYWESVYPRQDEDGDLELRATSLRWVGSQLDSAVRSVTLTKAGHNWYQYKQSRTIASENDALSDPAKQVKRQEAIGEGQIPPEEFDRGLDGTPAAVCQQIYDILVALTGQVQTLSDYCDQKFADAAPDFSPLRQTLEDVAQTARVLLKTKGGSETAATAQVEEPAQFGYEQSAAAEAFEPAAPALPGAGARPSPRGFAGIEPSSHDDAVARLMAASRYLRKENPFNSAGYLIPRMYRWGELRAAGFADPNLLVAPPADLRIALKRLASEGYWDQVGDLAENAAGEPYGRAWLDLQRYAASAVQFAGAEAALNAILAGLKSLLAELPQLLEWTLADDTPVANQETMAWLKQRGILPGAPAETQPAPPAPAPETWYPPAPPPSFDAAPSNGDSAGPLPPDAYDLAMQAAKSGNLEEALEILGREMAQEPCGRDRFLRKLQLARLCVATGNEAIGEPVLKELAEEIEHRKLTEWELADTIAQPLTLLYRCLDRGPDSAAEKQALYARICRLSPARAVRLAR